jgi:crotonobetainyl-CoA:carnitine CoA-transferase CaiB-like acyl-CoA transferase
VIYASLNAYGDQGPRRGFRGFDSVGQAITGMAIRWGGGKPKLQRFVVNDYGAGQMGAMGMLLTLYRRAVTGEGQAAHTSLAHSGTYHQFPFMIDYKGRVWDEPSGEEPLGWGPLDRLYGARDGWLYLALASGDRAVLQTCAGFEGSIGLEGDALARYLEAAFAQETVDVWLNRLQFLGLGAHRVVDFPSLIDDPWIRHRGLIVTRIHPGIGSVVNVGCIPRLSATPARALFPAPLPGWDTAAVVRESGFQDRYQELLDKGVVAEKLAEGVLLWL